MTNLYENMIDAIAAYFKAIETDIEADVKSDEKLDPEHINGQWVADALHADTDAMDAVANQVKAHVELLRRNHVVMDPKTDTAILSLAQLHDILANANLTVDTGEDGVRMPSCFDLDDEAKKEPKAVSMCNRLNDMLIEMRNLDSDFHDEFDCI